MEPSKATEQPATGTARHPLANPAFWIATLRVAPPLILGTRACCCAGITACSTQALKFGHQQNHGGRGLRRAPASRCMQATWAVDRGGCGAHGVRCVWAAARLAHQK